MTTRSLGPDFLLPGGPDPVCAGMDPAVFFPGQSDPADEARAACGRCDLATKCRAWALRQNPDTLWGVWGGMNQEERQEYRRLRDGGAR